MVSLHSSLSALPSWGGLGLRVVIAGSGCRVWMIVRLKERLVKVFVDYDQANNLTAAHNGPQVSPSLPQNPIPDQAKCESLL